MNSLLQNITKEPLFVLDKLYKIDSYIPISLSSSNKEINFDVSSSKKWTNYINNYLKNNNAKVAFGGYLEKRDIYNRSSYFKDNERDIHLGIDLWCKEGTNVLAVIDGEIHSFENNKNYGNYGPTIILKHQVESITFYSLYGHLTLQSLKNLKVGDKIKKEQIIGQLGSSSVNGDYAPHLHFQLIIDLQNNIGDYPGVSSKKNADFYAKNCPNPNLLLKLPNEI